VLVKFIFLIFPNKNRICSPPCRISSQITVAHLRVAQFGRTIHSTMNFIVLQQSRQFHNATLRITTTQQQKQQYSM